MLNLIAGTHKCNDIIRIMGKWSFIAFMHFSTLEEMRDFEDSFVKKFEGAFLDYAFDAMGEQSKLDWFPLQKRKSTNLSL